MVSMSETPDSATSRVCTQVSFQLGSTSAVHLSVCSVLDETTASNDSLESAWFLDNSIGATVPPTPTPLAYCSSLTKSYAQCCEPDKSTEETNHFDETSLLNITVPLPGSSNAIQENECSPLAKKPMLCHCFFTSADNNSLSNETTFLNVSTPSQKLTNRVNGSHESHEELSKSVAFSQPHSNRRQESSQQEAVQSPENENCERSSEAFLLPETPKSSKLVEFIDLVTPIKTSPRSPLLPTQPPVQDLSPKLQSSLCHSTLDSWLNWNERPMKRKQIDVEKYAFWSNISPDISPKSASSNRVLDSCDQVMKLSPECNRKVTTCNDLSCARNLTEQFLSVSAQCSSKLNSEKEDENMQSGKICHYEDILKKESVRVGRRFDESIEPNTVNLTVPSKSTFQKEESQNSISLVELDSLGTNQSSIFLTNSSSLAGLRKPEREVLTLVSALNRSNVVEVYNGEPQSQHALSLLKAISSPTFHQKDNNYKENEPISRFNSDGKVKRKKEERMLLHGFDCKCCASYYRALGLDDEERLERIDQVSKHRDVEPKPSTPEHYWEVKMPSREEQRRRGQIIESDSPVALKTRHPEYELRKHARRRLFA